jgi:hypothetical protein
MWPLARPGRAAAVDDAPRWSAQEESATATCGRNEEPARCWADEEDEKDGGSHMGKNVI